MQKNVFFMSVLRQPGRTLLLAVLVMVAAFAFVARATEYIIVINEIERIESFYRTIGVLSPINPRDISNSHDVTQAAQIVEASNHVSMADARIFTQGVLEDRTNTITNLVAFNYFVPPVEGMDMLAMDMYFNGRVLAGRPSLRTLGAQTFLVFRGEANYHFAGDGTTLRTEDRIWESPTSGRIVEMRRAVDFLLPITDDEAMRFAAGEWNPLDGLRGDREYLFRAIPGDRSSPVQQTLGFYLRPLAGGDDGLRMMPISEDSIHRHMTVLPQYRDDNLTFFVPVADTQAHSNMLEYLADDIAMARDNLHTLTVIGTQDMTVMPRMQNSIHARLVTGAAGGRWLTYEDHTSQSPVAVVSAQMAARRGLTVGETFTIMLRDNPRPAWIDNENTSPWSMGVDGWWETTPQNWWGLMENRENWREFDTHTLELEVVGVYWFFPPAGAINNFTAAELYVPASLIPAGFGWNDAPLLTGSYSFMLTGPRATEPFLAQNWQALNELGFVAQFLPNGFEHFAAVSDPIITSITVNLVMFSAVASVILALVVFLYLRQWKRTVAIARGLGMPSKMVVGRLFVPVLFMWVPAIAAGSAAAWFFAIFQAQTNLATLGGDAYGYNGYGEILLSPDIFWLPMMAAGIALLTFMGILIFGSMISRRPVLEQLQGGVQKKAGTKQKHVDPGEAPVEFVAGSMHVGAISYISHMQKSKRDARRANFIHSLRHIFRAPIKSLLGLGLAMFFVLSLGWLYNTINFMEREVERLWDETVVTAQVARSPEDDRHFGGWQEYFATASISSETMNVVMSSGFVDDNAYLEAQWQFAFIVGGDSASLQPGWSTSEQTHIITGVSHLNGFVEENARGPMDDQLGVWGNDLEIEFAPGFGPEHFVFGAPDEAVPVIIRRDLLASEGLALGDVAMIVEAFTSIDMLTMGRIIGVFDGGLNRAVNRFGDHRGAIIMPLAALQHITYDHMIHEAWDIGGLTYITARFDVDPSRNRQIDEMHETLEAVLARNHLGVHVGPMPLELLVDDDVLNIVIPAMEQNLALFRVLFPIAISVSIALAMGTAILLMMTNAKNAAVMRVLGKTSGSVRRAMIAEQILVCIVGIGLGLIAIYVLEMGSGVALFDATPLVLAALYFAGAVVGCFIGAIVVSSKTPLEMLQVRE